MEIIFGPVHSRRFGRSLGVDLSPYAKQCNFDCVYCELQRAKSVESMKTIVPVDEVVNAVQKAIVVHKCDVLTLTANGEPTLYPHLKELISTLKIIVPDSIKLLLLTNGSLLWRDDVRECLKKLDIVKFSCDALEEKAFKHIDRPHSSLSLEQIKEGIIRFCEEFQGEIIAEVLFVKGINDTHAQAQAIAAFLAALPIHRVDIGSIDRPPAYKVEAISEESLESLAAHFYAYPHLNVSLPKRSKIQQDSILQSYDTDELLGLIKRRPLSVIDAQKMLDSQTLALLYQLCQKGTIKQCRVGENEFYQVVD
ncbi:radical SAM protein [Helicobacter sp. MIT 21-1697]|uniref:radical SAM protein n=1 Tax=Helicobacter sp. MIT 21-1697 TaxID=2993733 RepID=UPI00224B932A|nr:radical SAM protein [Helicobacter sp. MIT 21-1697]MCX2716625.1 radical SAM protein [Helicobacter sp. MIT 21-1697]